MTQPRAHAAGRAVLTVALALCCLLPATALADSAKTPTRTPKKGDPQLPVVKDDSLPEALELLAKFRKICGYEKLRKTVNQRVKGSFAMPAQGITATMEARLAFPNLSHVLIDIPGMGLSQEGFDGTHGWALDPMQGPQIKRGDAAAEAAFKADYLASLDDSRYTKAETVAIVEFAGRKAYKARFTQKVGGDMFLFFDVETGLELGQEETLTTPMGELPVSIKHKEYKEFGGMRFPTVMEQSAMGMTQVITIKSIEFNVDLPPFELPEAVKALVTEQAAPEGG